MSKLPIALGTQTPWGKISMVGLTGGERYYWMVDEDKAVAMMPADVVEQHLTNTPNCAILR